VADWKPLCIEARGIPSGGTVAARRFFEARFVPHAVSAGDRPMGRFTGYFEPELKASLAREGRYVVPIYGRPDDLVTVDLGRFRDAWKGERIAGKVEGGALVPYPARDAIEAGALDGRAPVLAWADDPVDVFFLHIQGSGRLVFRDRPGADRGGRDPEGPGLDAGDPRLARGEPRARARPDEPEPVLRVLRMARRARPGGRPARRRGHPAHA
jgi:membrane-bound lytic murein transglycosylase A